MDLNPTPFRAQKPESCEGFLLGISDAVLVVARDYSLERDQFGQPIDRGFAREQLRRAHRPAGVRRHTNAVTNAGPRNDCCEWHTMAVSDPSLSSRCQGPVG